jgi:hypothetical protein
MGPRRVVIGRAVGKRRTRERNGNDDLGFQQEFNQLRRNLTRLCAIVRIFRLANLVSLLLFAIRKILLFEILRKSSILPYLRISSILS